MSRVRVKICGVTTRAALDAAVDAGADAVGFVMSPSPRQIDPEAAADLIARLPPWVASVVVTRHPPAGFAAEVLSRLSPDWWQTDLADVDGQAVPPGTRVLPVIREGEATPAMPPAFVYEGARSGQGQTVDWQIAAGLARQGHMVLAGGLTVHNVAQAIRSVQPWAVDVSSGVERERGLKDPDLIHQFLANVQAEA